MNPANLTMNPANLSGFLKLQVLPNCLDLNFPPKTAQIGWIQLKFGHFFGFTYFSVGHALHKIYLKPFLGSGNLEVNVGYSV